MARGSSSSQLRVSFVVDSGGLRSGFQRATRETDRFGRSTQRSARQTAMLGASLRRAALAAAGAAAAYVSIAQARRAIETTQELALTTMGLERNLGLATKEASRWAAVTKARGVDSKTLVMSFTSLSRAIDGARKGTESSVEVFDKLGISQKQLRGTQGDFSKQVQLVADAFGDAEGSATRQAAAQKLLGRGYRDILPLFTEGSKGLQEQLKWADEFGATMGKDTVAAMSDFTTAQRRGRVALMGLQIAFAKAATPAITEAIDELGNLATVLNDPNLSKGEKLARLREEFGRLQDRVISVINDLVPMVAQSAGEIGVALAKGVGRGFLETGILGKAAIGVFFVSAMGGPRAIMGAGATVGALFSAGMAGSSVVKGAFAQTTWLAQSFGRGPVTARIAGAGAALGQVGALGFVKAFARFLPPAMAALAIVDIISNALVGDMKSAGIKAGGALVGGIAGFFLGGPVGAMLGVGIGTLGASLGKKLFDTFGSEAERQSVSVGERIAASVDRLAAAATRENTAYQRLGRASDYAADSRRKQRAATDRVRAAEAQLALARQRFGPNSEQAIAAEQRLTRAKNANARATERVRAAQRLEGAERKAAQNVIEANVRIAKTEIRQLGRREAAIAKRLANADRLKLSDEQIQRLGRKQVRLSVQSEKAQRQLNNAYLRAGREIGPKFAESLRKITGFSASVSGSLRKLTRPIIQVGRNSQTSFQRAQNYFGDWAAAVRKRSGSVNSNMRSMPKVQTSATDRMIEDLKNKIGVIGNMGTPQARRRGGKITGATKLVTAAVSPGELISYGNHEIIVPGRPEPRDSVLMNLPVGAKVFTHDGQMRRALGASDAEAIRDQAPHFQAGGIVRPRISGGSPMANRAANKGVGVVHRKAERVYQNNMISDLDSVVRFASKFGLSVSSGYRLGDDGYHGVNRARDFVGSTSEMFSFAKWIGTRFGHKLLELIYSPLGWSIKNYQRVAPYAVADHYDHVHVALRKGGQVTAKSPMRKKRQWGPNALHTLASAVGMPNPGLMAQIAQAESGGNAKLNNAGLNPDGSIDYGLWQINSIHGKPVSGMLNPIMNAYYARDILRSQGLGAWVAYTNGRYSGFSGGRFDQKFYYDLIYTKEQQRKALKAARSISGRVRRMDGRADDRGATPAAKKRIRLATKAAKRAVRLARVGDVDGARRAIRTADSFLDKAASGITTTGGGSPGGGTTPADGTTPTTPTSPTTPGVNDAANAKRINQLLALAAKSKGPTKESLLSDALSIAQNTETTADDLQVLGKQRDLQEGRRARALKRLKAINRKLSKGGLSKKERRRLLREKQNVLQSLGAATSEISSIDAQISDLGADTEDGGDDGASDLAEAMKELADAIAEQNRLQSSVQATSSREALRMLSDVISGEIVGKRVPVGQTPTGVRY